MIKMSLDPLRARQLFNFIGTIVDEFRLHVSKEGWKVAAVDPANIAMGTIDLPKENFQSYEFMEEDQWTGSIDGHPTGVLIDEIAVGIDVVKVKEFISGFSSTVERVLDMELHEPIEFAFVRAAEKHQYHNYSSPRFDLILKQGMFSRKILLMHESTIRKEPKIPALDLDYKFNLDTLELLRIVLKREKADYIRFGYERESREAPVNSSMKFKATVEEEDDIYTVEKYLERDEFQGLRGFTGDSASSLMSMDYLHDVVPTIPSGNVWVYIGKDYPVKLEFTIGMTGQCQYMQAPRVETE